VELEVANRFQVLRGAVASDNQFATSDFEITQVRMVICRESVRNVRRSSGGLIFLGVPVARRYFAVRDTLSTSTDISAVQSATL
jgi:hypothetical protein